VTLQHERGARAQIEKHLLSGRAHSMPPLVIENLDSLKDFVGREIGATDWFGISQERIRQFAEATEDRQWIHLDPARAKQESPYVTTIAHGFLTLSLLSHLSKQALQIQDGSGMVVNYGLNRVRFPAPVPADSKIRARFSLQSLEDVGNSREAIFSVVVEVQSPEGQTRPKPCCVADWIIRYYPGDLALQPQSSVRI
jgi:acyl dehydratase